LYIKTPPVLRAHAYAALKSVIPDPLTEKKALGLSGVQQFIMDILIPGLKKEDKNKKSN
jgi:hypothetical protein